MSKELVQDVDGELYIGEQEPPSRKKSGDESNFNDGLWGETKAYFLEENATVDSVLYERVLAKWKDPTSLPHSRNKCVKYFTTKFPRIKTCIGWKLEFAWIYRTATLRVTTGKEIDIGAVVEKCLAESAIIAAIAGLVTGGSAAAAAAEASFKACLLRRIGKDLLTVSVSFHTTRGDWE